MDCKKTRPISKVSNSDPVVVLLGPTAIGKTELSLQLAEEFNGEIIGVDSMQIYKFMDVGTAKPTQDERARVKHHLVDFVDPAEDYSVSRFIEDAQQATFGIRESGKIPFMVGGTGLYFRGYFEGMFELPAISAEVRLLLEEEWQQNGSEELYYELQLCDPDSAKRIHPNDKMRLIRALEIYRSTGKTWSKLITEHQEQIRSTGKSPGQLPLKIGLMRDRQELYDRINLRVELMVEQGIVNEVEKLLAKGYNSTLKSMQSLGYRHILNYLDNSWTWEKSLELLARDTRRYAKRQLTWFKKDKDILWYSPARKSEIFSKVREYFQAYNQSVG